MKRSLSYPARPFSVFAAACLGFSGLATAQQAAKDPFAAGDAPVAPDPFSAEGADGDPFGSGPPEVRFDLDFPGGTIAELIDQIDATLPNPPSIIMPDGTDRAPVPPMKLKQIAFRHLTTLIHDVTSQSEMPILIEESVGEHWVVRIDGPPPEPRQLAIFHVDRLLEERSIEDLLAVIDRAFTVAGKAAPEFHLHDETKVLLSSLTVAEEDIVVQLVAVLQKPKGESDSERLKKQRQIDDELAKLKERYYEQSLQLATLEAKAATEEDKKAAQRVLIESEILAAELRMLESEMSAYMELITRMRARELGLDDELHLPPPTRGSNRSGPPASGRSR